jgi:hypothetical protein
MPHAVEDKNWAEERLGAEPIKGAYAWRTLRKTGVPIKFNSSLPRSATIFFTGCVPRLCDKINSRYQRAVGIRSKHSVLDSRFKPTLLGRHSRRLAKCKQAN